MSLISTRVCQHLASIGYNMKQSSRFASLVEKWTVCNGKEWTASRLKTLTETHLQQLATGSFTIPKGWRTKVSRKGKIVFSDGLVRSVFELPLTNAGLIKRQAFLRVYQVITLDATSKAQMSKFISNVTADYNDSECVNHVVDALRHTTSRYASDLKRVRSKIRINDWGLGMIYTPRSNVSSPVFKLSPDTTSFSMSKVLHSKTAIMSDWSAMLTDPIWSEIVERYPGQVSACLIGNNGDMIQLPKAPIHVNKCIMPVGTIGFIQEPGAKLRSIANPNLVIQALGAHLKNTLASICQHHDPCIYTFDQDAGKSVAVKWLSQGHTVSSYDMTAFTDRFPYAIQRDLLTSLIREGICDQFDLEVLDRVIASDWLTKSPEGDMGLIRWKVGQPLGFNPSFHLATITHSAILRHCVNVKQGIRLIESPFKNGGFSDFYAVVGDDVIIRDLHVAEEYAKVMCALEVKISTNKSITSPVFAEFCGKLLTRDGEVSSIKTRMITSESQFIKYMDFYGRDLFKNIATKDEFKWARAAMLPKAVGGSGLRPHGMPYSVWMSYLKLDKIEEHMIRSFLTDTLGLSVTEEEVKNLNERKLAFAIECQLFLARSGREDSGGIPFRMVNYIPVINSVLSVDTEIRNQSRYNTFVDLVDVSSRQLLGNSPTSTHGSISSVSVSTEQKRLRYTDITDSDSPVLKEITYPVTTYNIKRSPTFPVKGKMGLLSHISETSYGLTVDLSNPDNTVQPEGIPVNRPTSLPRKVSYNDPIDSKQQNSARSDSGRTRLIDRTAFTENSKPSSWVGQALEEIRKQQTERKAESSAQTQRDQGDPYGNLRQQVKNIDIAGEVCAPEPGCVVRTSCDDLSR